MVNHQSIKSQSKVNQKSIKNPTKAFKIEYKKEIIESLIRYKQGKSVRKNEMLDKLFEQLNISTTSPGEESTNSFTTELYVPGHVKYIVERIYRDDNQNSY